MEKSFDRTRTVIFFDIDYTLFDTDGFKTSGLVLYKLYNEVNHTLNVLSKSAILGIFSEGEEAFQMQKLENTGIDKFFDRNNIYIFLNKKEHVQEVLKKYAGKNIFVVDDRKTMLECAKVKGVGVKTVWLKRGIYLSEESDYVPDYEINTVAEVLEIVK